MSYILDALRRAEAERGRGAVPSLNTPGAQAPGLPDGGSHSRARAVAVAVGAALAAAALAAGGMWWWQQRPSAVTERGAPAAATGVAVPAAVPVAAAASSAVAESAPASAPAPARASAAPQPPESRVAPAPPAPSTPPVLAQARTRQPAAQRAAAPEAAREAARSARPAPAPAATPAPAPAAAPRPAATSGTVFAPGDLPASVRGQLPNLQIAGVTYSSNPLYRMAIVNGQVLHEGDAAAPGLTLERVEPGRTVWAFQGYRYAVPSK